MQLIQGCHCARMNPLRRWSVAGRRWGSAVRPVSNVSTFLQRISDVSRKNDVAVIDSFGSVTYGELDSWSNSLASLIDSKATPNMGRTIAGFNPANRHYVLSLLAAWKCRRPFLPLCPVHPENELRYFLQDSSAGTVLASSHAAPVVNISALSVPTIQVDYKDLGPAAATEPFEGNGADDALVLYTSGTTGRPKGVMHTSTGLESMMSDVVSAWEYEKKDKILHFLPLHHLHGVLNKLLCSLYAGSTTEFLPSANAEVIWASLAREASSNQPVTMFMAVPTVYAKMLEHYRDVNKSSASAEKEALKHGVMAAKNMRLMVSGSAALPDNILHAWKDLTGHTLLERYGMTEIGMALTNPYRGFRRPGYVGKPFRSVQCRIVDDQGNIITAAETPGELRIKGPTVFKKYLNRPKDTAEAFDADSWFKTGDVAVVNEAGEYRLLGRMSADIIKVFFFEVSSIM
jgi:malonyl-CoA/methylmalonyl-CoA synthetase